MKAKYLIYNIVFIICFTLIINMCIDYYVNSFDSNTQTLSHIRCSSVWCNGLDHTERRCRFENLCFKKDTKDYILLIDDKLSIISGVPSDRFSPALLDLSSVRDHNQYYFDYVEIPFSVLSNNLSQTYKIERIAGKTIIMGRFKPDNLMHWIHDDLIPLYFTLHELGFKQINNILFDDNWPEVLGSSLQFSQFIYNSLFPQLLLSRDQMKDNTIYCFEEAFVGLTKSMNWYEYGFRTPQSPISRSAHESALISKTIRRLTQDLIKVTECTTNYVIFISRKSTRKILNEEKLLNLISQLTPLSIIRLTIEDFTKDFEQILSKVYCARLMIGMHGSALILSIFLQSGSSLIELFPFAINPHDFTPYKTLTQLHGMDINYFWWKNLFINNTVTHEEYPKELGGIEHMSSEEKADISSNREDVPKHLCCSNVYFLYRIYQDTIVDTDSLTPILKAALHSSTQPKTAIKRELASSHVIDLHCSRTSKDNIIYIRIVWEEPWNVVHLKQLNTKIKYEILIEDISSGFANSSLLTEREYIFASNPGKTFNIWIRCKLNEIYGPFNVNPIVC